MKKAHVTRQVRKRGEKRELHFSYGKCFPYKSSFSKSSPRFLLECSIFKECLLFYVNSLSVKKGAMD